MYFDFKITSWVRAQVSKEKEAYILELIKSGKITNVFDLMDELKPNEYEVHDMSDSWEAFTVEENGGCSTIEVIGDDGQIPFKNAEY